MTARFYLSNLAEIRAVKAAPLSFYSSRDEAERERMLVGLRQRLIDDLKFTVAADLVKVAAIAAAVYNVYVAWNLG